MPCCVSNRRHGAQHTIGVCRGDDGLPADERERQALDALRAGWPAGTVDGCSYDVEYVLQLCHFQTFKEGLLFLFDRMQDPARQLQVC